jgi:hypothetical protein
MDKSSKLTLLACFFMLITDLVTSTLVAMILIAIPSREKTNATVDAICNDLQLHQY